MAHAISVMSLARTVRTAACAGTMLSACSGGGSPAAPAPPVLARVAVSLSAFTVQVGWTDTASAEGFDQNGAPIKIDAPVWTTSSGAVATVDSRGVVTGVSIGLASIIAKVGGMQGQIALPVVPVAVATVVVDPPAASLSPGDTIRFAATTLDAVGDTLAGRPVTWSSTKAAVATVSPAGLVTAVTAGTAVIVASSGEASAAAAVVVTGAIAPGVTVTFSKPTRGQVVGDTLPVFVTASSANRITGAVASVGSLEMPLTRILIGASGVIEAWIGTMNLAGTIFGTQQVIVKATDSQNIFGIDSVSFVRKKLVLGGSSPAPKRKRVVPVVPVKVP
jgi:hypothetical protein